VGWIAVGVVVAVLAVFIVVKVTSGPSIANTSNGVASGQDPATASSAITTALATIPASVFDSVGTDGQPVPFTVTAKQPPLASGKLPRVVWYGSEFCPYCAMGRWPLVVALDRFGTFTNLKVTSSANSDGNVPTLSFLRSSFSSPYLDFTPYEVLDRNSNPLQSVPTEVSDLYTTYDGTASGPSKFDSAAGIPFIDVANKFVSAGTPAVWNQNVFPALQGGGPGWVAVAQGLHDPTSTYGVAITAKLLIAQANFITAAICTADGGKPSSVCSTSGVKAASTELAAAKPIS